MGEFDYYKLLQAVENYYGSGSDQWAAIATGSATAAERAAILKQVPGVYTTVNESGELLSWALDVAPSSMTAAESAAATAAQSINSNAVTVAVKELSIPGNAVLNETTGIVEMSSGATKMTGAAVGSKVATAAGHVGTWVVGAAVGLKLGVWIDNLAYNANPDFWEARNWGPVNPELWKSTKITNWLYDYSGYDDFMCLVDDEGQMYIDEQVLALAAQYLAVNGCYEPNEEYCTDDDLDSDLFYHPEYKTGEYPYYVNEVYFERRNPPSNPYIFNIKAVNNTEPVYIFLYSPNSDGTNEFVMECLSKADFDIEGSALYVSKGSFVNKAGETIYTAYCSSNWTGSYFYPLVNFTHLLSGMDNNFVSNDISILLYHGYRGKHGKEGFYPYAPTPQGITPGMTGDDIINLLKQQYPEIWNPTDPTQPGPIKNGALQDDGTIADHVYIPVPVPDGGTEGQPETTPQTPQKPDPENPVSTQTVVKIVQPTPNPDDQPDPETGEGNTPTAPAPTGSANALYKIYNPTNAQIQQFGAWLWSSNFVDQLLKVFNDPMQAIISLHKIYATPHIGGAATIKVGYLDSQVPSDWVDQQYIDVDCGSVNVFETSGNVIDYMCDIRIYLPFIGIVSLDVDDVMRGVVNVKYRIDVITGTCVAFVSITRDAGAGGVIYQYTGSMAEVYPLSSGSYMGIITGVLGIAAGIAGTIASGGAAAPALIGGAAGLTAMHTKVEHSNGFSGNAGALAAKKPYIIISRPQSAMSNGIGANTGWPANYYVKLSQCSGYTRAKTLHLTGISGATDTELQEIERLLKEGVII